MTGYILFTDIPDCPLSITLNGKNEAVLMSKDAVARPTFKWGGYCIFTKNRIIP
jgi:hypothetical protein